MPAKLTYTTLAEVPEGIREFAKEGDDGQYVVVVDGADKVKEFRDKNIEVVKERDSLTAALTQYEQVTGVPLPDLETGKLSDFASALESLRDTKKRVDDGTLVENTSLEEAAANRVTEATQTMKAQLAEMAKDRDAHKNARVEAERRAESMQVENAVRLVASDPDVGMHDKAVNFILPHALQTFKVEGANVTAKAADGTVIYGSDGVTPLTIKEWLIKQRDDSDFLFKGAKGGGASGNGDTAAGGRLTQAELDKMKPQQRMQYARKHGLV